MDLIRVASLSPIRIDPHPPVNTLLHQHLPEVAISIIYAIWKRLKATVSLLGSLSNHCSPRIRFQSTLQKYVGHETVRRHACLYGCELGEGWLQQGDEKWIFAFCFYVE